MGTETWHQALHNIYNTIVSDILNSFIEMGVRWALTELMMTAATRLGALMRTALHLSAVETTTGATVAGATTQIGAHAATAGAGAASSQASIPYVGPILAVAAMVAIFAAVMALAHGFEQGGYTGSGGSGEVAGVVHKGEFVLNKSTVDRVGLDNLQVLHNGGTPAMMDLPENGVAGNRGGYSGGSKGGGLSNVHVHFDENAMRHHIERSDAMEDWVVNIMTRNIHKFR